MKSESNKIPFPYDIKLVFETGDGILRRKHKLISSL